MRASTSRASAGSSANTISSVEGARAAATAQRSANVATVSTARDHNDCVRRCMPRSLLARRRGVRWAYANVQFAQLLLGDCGWRVDEQVLAALRFRKRDHVANRFGAAHQRHHPVEAERDAAVRRRAVLECVQQKAELPPLVFGRNAESGKDFLLHLGTVDSHRAAAYFPAVQHDVVGLGKRLRRLIAEQRFVPVLGRRERMVPRAPALALLVVFEHWKVDDPQATPTRLNEATIVADLCAQRSQ